MSTTQAQELVDKIRRTFSDFCVRAQHEQCKHVNAARRNESWKNFHSLTVIFINLFTGSVLFASLKAQIPDAMKWGAATLALLAASCSAIQIYFKYPEKTDAHKAVARRFAEFIDSCKITVLDFDKGGASVESFHKLLRKHKEQYDQIMGEAALLTAAERDRSGCPALPDSAETFY
jgi:hypothetical protein